MNSRRIGVRTTKSFCFLWSFRWLRPVPLLAALLGFGPAPAAAQGSGALHHYALVVGVNEGSAGQPRLRFAERDAQRVGNLLVELGRFGAEQTKVLLGPTRTRLQRTLAELRHRLAEHRERNEETSVFFYYSGHARARSINLGAQEMSLRDLRAAITDLPTNLTLVVLDACQSGAFSRTKGAEPAADFSYNSVSSLNTEGVAIIASSSDDELSQESDRLQASFFTHHLLVSLRGAGDRDRDGRVTLDEAYRYAYDRTLADTSRTAVGGQHVMLETDLTGHGRVPLSYPRDADASLQLSERLRGTFLIQRKQGRETMAELHKARGRPLRLAFPAGHYDIVWRRPGSILECDVELRSDRIAHLRSAMCSRVKDPPATAKGGTPSPVRERWGFELGVGFGGSRDGGFTDRLGEFDYQVTDEGGFRFSAGAERYVLPNLSLAVQLNNLDGREYVRRGDDDGPDTEFGWSTLALGLHVRGSMPVIENWLRAYGQIGGGPALASSRIRAPDLNGEPDTSRDLFWGFHLGVAAGAQVSPWRSWGFYGQLGYAIAPVLDNLLGDQHDSGGTMVILGIRSRLWGPL